jgi:hypothetical protein
VAALGGGFVPGGCVLGQELAQVVGGEAGLIADENQDGFGGRGGGGAKGLHAGAD